MSKNEGQLLKNKFLGTGKKIPEIAAILGMTRQNLNVHLKKDILGADFKRLVKEKQKEIFQMENESARKSKKLNDELWELKEMAKAEEFFEIDTGMDYQKRYLELLEKTVKDQERRINELEQIILNSKNVVPPLKKIKSAE